MTIDEFIEHSIEVAEENRINANSIESNMYIPLSVDKDNLIDNCIKCAEEHEQLARWLDELKFLRTTKETMYREIYEKGRADAEAEHKAMCESCIHKVSADDLRAIKYDAVDELSIKCITHIQEAKPLTIEEIIHIIRFNADQMKGE